MLSYATFRPNTIRRNRNKGNRANQLKETFNCKEDSIDCGLFSFTIVARRYKYRKRDDRPYNYDMVEDTFD